MKDLEAASIEDVRDFFRTYYVRTTRPGPGGRLRHEGSHRAGAAVSRTDSESPPGRCRAIFPRSRRRQERRGALEENWPLPVVVVAYHITFDGNPDSYPLHIASKVLSDGESSRIYRKLVYEKQPAWRRLAAATSSRTRTCSSRWRSCSPGRSRRTPSTALIAELDRLRTQPISEAELQQAKNQWTRDYILSRESNKEKASQLGHAVVIHNDVKTADEFDIFMNTTAADVQRSRRPTSGRRTGWC